ncbi:hypothetical protein BY996DRAFT_6583232 [Phakopsora pachyrhizi]|nr:hypothetical protein BY996DRAFT_6583232 [Phakopsora pachyrhizi]
MTSGTFCLFLATLRSSSLKVVVFSNSQRPQDPVFADYLPMRPKDWDAQLTFSQIPANQLTWKFGDHHPEFIYYCENETEDQDNQRTMRMVGVIFGGAQKNMGPSGVEPKLTTSYKEKQTGRDG